MNTIMTCTFGSHLYGTSTPSSDIDLKSVYIPDGKNILLQKVKGSITNKRSKGLGEKNYAGEVDEESYSIQNFMKLVSEGQTVSLDVLFASPESIVQKNDVWDYLVANRHKLLSKRSEAFIGYCNQQAKKYGIKGSRVAAARDSLNFLKMHAYVIQGMNIGNSKLGLLGHQIFNFAKSQDNEFVKIVIQDFLDKPQITFFEVCGRKMSYTASLNNAIDILQRLVDEYGTRALMAEKNEGVDWKAISHAVRIAQQAVELFQTHNIIFPRPNADELLRIKTGQLPYKQVAEQIEDLFLEVKAASEASTLPSFVDQDWINDFVEATHLHSIIEDYALS